MTCTHLSIYENNVIANNVIFSYIIPMRRGAKRGKIPINTPSVKVTHSQPQAEPLPESLTRWPGFMLAWVADAAVKEYTQALATIGIRPQHLGILTLLQSKGAMVQARLGDHLSIVKPAIVGLVNELEAMGLVERRPHVKDGRAFEIFLLEAGVQRIRQAESVSRNASSTFFETLKPAEQKTFMQMLTRLANSASQRASAQSEEPS